MKHTLIALVEDRPGVLQRVASLFARRNFNIESLAVGHTHEPGLSRMTIVVDGTDAEVDQVERNLHKLVDVHDVHDVSDVPTVLRELALIKVSVDPTRRPEVLQLAEVYRARAIDVGMQSLILEVTGDEAKIDSMVELMRPFGIEELVRTGVVAMARGTMNGVPHDEGELAAISGEAP